MRTLVAAQAACFTSSIAKLLRVPSEIPHVALQGHRDVLLEPAPPPAGLHACDGLRIPADREHLGDSRAADWRICYLTIVQIEGDSCSAVVLARQQEGKTIFADRAGHDCGEEDVRQFLIGAGVAARIRISPRCRNGILGFLPAGALLVWRSRGSLRGSRHRGLRAPRRSDPAPPRNHHGAVVARGHRRAGGRSSQRDRGGPRWRPRLDARKPRGVLGAPAAHVDGHETAGA
jgi:hypothetical protein